MNIKILLTVVAVDLAGCDLPSPEDIRLRQTFGLDHVLQQIL